MALNTGNVFLVQALTGHKMLTMVQRYVNVKASDAVVVMHATKTGPAAPALVKASAPVGDAGPGVESERELVNANNVTGCVRSRVTRASPGTVATKGARGRASGDSSGAGMHA